MSPQTVGHITSKHVTLALSADGIDWSADVSGSVTAVTPGGGESMTGSSHVFGAHIPIIGIGKKNPVTYVIRYPYTEVDAEMADLIDGYFENQDLCYLRYRPRGSQADGWEFTGAGYWTTPVTPATDATTADIVSNEATWFGVELARGDQATT